MDKVLLPISASRGQIVSAIDTVQQRARTGLANAHELAATVTEQLERGDAMAGAIGRQLTHLRASGMWWQDGDGAQRGGRVTTLVELVSYPRAEIVVRRAAPPVTVANGRLTLVLE